MIRRSAVGLYFLVAGAVIAQPYQIESAPVAVTAEIKAEGLTREWKDLRAATQALANEAAMRIDQYEGLRYWRFAPNRNRPVTVHIRVFNPAEQEVKAEIIVTGCPQTETRFDDTTLYEPTEVRKEGWPQPENGPADVRRRVNDQLLTDVNLNRLFTVLRAKNCAALGTVAQWHEKAKSGMSEPWMVLPIQWNEHFRDFNFVIGADGTPNGDAFKSIVFGQSIPEWVVASDRAGQVTSAMVARARCVERDRTKTPSREVPTLVQRKLSWVFLEEVAETPVNPVSARCSVLRIQR